MSHPAREIARVTVETALLALVLGIKRTVVGTLLVLWTIPVFFALLLVSGLLRLIGRPDAAISVQAFHEGVDEWLLHQMW